MSSRPSTASEKNNGLEETLGSLIALTGLSERDYQILLAHASQTDAWMKEIFDDFYDAILTYAPTADFFLVAITPRTSDICIAGFSKPPAGNTQRVFGNRNGSLAWCIFENEFPIPLCSAR